MNQAITRRFALALICMAVLAVSGCKNPLTRDEKQPAPEAPALVAAMAISPSPNHLAHVFSGEVRGRYETALGFRVPGKVIARHVETGTRVNAGDVLMELDPKDIKEAVTAARAQAEAAASQSRLAADLLKRFKALYDQDFMSQAELDRYQNGADSAAAVLKQARAQLTQAANQLSYCTLKADRSGVVLDVRAEAGQVVGAGQPVLIMATGPEREIEIFVPENQVGEFDTGAAFTVSFWALPGTTVKGQARFVSPVADPVTRTYKARVTLVGPPDTVRLGMTASAVSQAHNDLSGSPLFIPLSAVYQTGDVPKVWVIENRTARLRMIRLGPVGSDDQIQVVEGLSAGDVIVTAGVHKLLEGQAVRTQGAEK